MWIIIKNHVLTMYNISYDEKRMLSIKTINKSLHHCVPFFSFSSFKCTSFCRYMLMVIIKWSIWNCQLKIKSSIFSIKTICFSTLIKLLCIKGLIKIGGKNISILKKDKWALPWNSYNSNIRLYDTFRFYWLLIIPALLVEVWSMLFSTFSTPRCKKWCYIPPIE